MLRAGQGLLTLPQPFLRFYHSASLREKTLAVLTALEKAKDPRPNIAMLWLPRSVEKLTDSGMEYFFLRPLKLAKAGFFMEQWASLGMSATTAVLGTVIRNMIGGMDGWPPTSQCVATFGSSWSETSAV